MRTPTRRRLLALAGLTALTVATGSIAGAEDPTAEDVATEALAASAAVQRGTGPTDVTVEDPAGEDRRPRSPAVAPRDEATAAEPAPAPAPQVETTTMVASWYGPNFHGNLTANGEVYDQWGMTAAHKSLAFGTELEVTNPATGRSVVVRVNDRGPFISGRDLDLSRGAADAIGLSGVREVEIVHR